MKQLNDIKTILVAGAGTLGMRIALRCAFDGYRVNLYDISDSQLNTAESMQKHLTGKLLAAGSISAEQAHRAEQNMVRTTDLDVACADVDLVSESVIEDIEIKLGFYSDLTPRLQKGTIVTTNTSFLMPSQMLPSIQEPEYFCALHFHDVFTQVVLDVMPHPDTSQETVDLLMEFGKTINHVPVFVRKENPGYMFNAMFGEILSKAGEMYVDGVGSMQDIDRSFMGNFHTPAGPFGMLDMIGLDTAWHIMSKSLSAKTQEFSEELKARIDAGKLGYKTGEGFYTYPRPEYMDKGFLHAESNSD